MSELNKPRQLSLPLDYFKMPTRVQRWKGRFGWALFGLTIGGLTLHWAMNREAHFGASPGPVSAPHQAWDDTCSACHDAFQVTSSHSWAPPGMKHTASQSCRTCHAGPMHHVNQTPHLNCASCHREHKGRDFSLVKMADSNCTQCHDDLHAHCTSEALPQYGNVSMFAKGKHPDFRSIKSDPGKIYFNHSLHMSPGMLEGAKFMLKNIPAEYRERYASLQKDNNPNAPVELTCRACHQMESADFKLSFWELSEIGPSALTPRSSGNHFLPIVYENQCKACHPLQVEDRMADKGAKVLTVPHRKQPVELDRWLSDYFTAQAVRGIAGFEEMKAPRPLPGKKSAIQLEPTLKKRIDDNVESARKSLYLEPLKKNCRLCHPLNEVKKSEAGEEPLFPFPTIPSAEIPQVWLKHARFDHMSHRALDCRACHGNAYPRLADGAVNKDVSHAQTSVMIPGLDNCVQCHAPKSTVTQDGHSQRIGGVRYDCVLCHTFHNGRETDQPLAGRGAEARGAGRPRIVEEVLKGER